MKLILLILFDIVVARDVYLSSGLGNYTDSELWSQYTSFKAYKDIGIITGSSILLYNLNEDGTLGKYNTSANISAEQYQFMLKNNLGLRAMPCLYCDATIGMCSNLSSRLNNLYQNMDEFIYSTIKVAYENNWDGYFVDFEPDSEVDPKNLTDFIIEWSKVMKENKLELNIWTGEGYYDNRIFNNTNLTITTMDTYNAQYKSFLEIASTLQVKMKNINNLAFGLLTNYGYKTNDLSNDIMSIIDWSILTKSNSLSLWTSHIPPDWYISLKKYVDVD